VNAHVHLKLTRRWALEEGFSAEDAEAVAQADVAVDREHPGPLAWHALKDWRYHYRLFGAERDARRRLALAVETGSLVELGTALHHVQDSIAHGWLGLLRHALDPGTDLWDRRSPAVREALERRSRELLRAYREGRAAGAGQVPDSDG
jgi:hypothetical protein